MDPILAVAFFIVGLAFGSFLNVCISRIPRGLSVIAPRSFCPNCTRPIAARDNIPVISCILLGRRCRSCRGVISPRYPAVELLTAILFVACYATLGQSWMALKASVLCFLLVGLIFMDAETGYLPAEFTYPGIVLGLIAAWLIPVDSSGTELLMREYVVPATFSFHAMSFLDALIAALFGAAFFFLAWATYYLVRRRDGVGFGDIAMMAMVGTFLGLKLTLLVVFLAPVMASLYALTLFFRRPVPAGGPRPSSFLMREVPFGVFLGISALTSLFLGQAIWRWYLSLFL